MDYIIDSGYWYGSYIESSTFTITNSCVMENPTVLSDGVVNVSDGGLTTTA